LFLASYNLNDRTEGAWGRPAAILYRNRYQDEWLIWGGYTFIFEEGDGNHFVCTGLIISKDYDLAMIEKLLKFVGTDVISYLEFDDWI